MGKRTVLIAEDDSDLAQFLTTELRVLGYDVFRSPDAMHALLGAHRLKPSLMLIDVNMPGGNGLSVCEMLASDRELCRIPVIMMSGRSDQETIRRCKLAGARFVAKGPALWSEIEAAIRHCLSDEPRSSDEPKIAAVDNAHSPVGDSNSPGNRSKIVSIDDDPDISKILKSRLEPYGVDVVQAHSGMQGFWTCLEVRPAVIILDLKMSDGDGNYVLHRLKTHSLTEKIPVLVLTGQKNPAVKRQLLSQGVTAFLNKPFKLDELLEHLRPLVRLRPEHAACH
jgi:DNA-binding response OmpR family regulator